MLRSRGLQNEVKIGPKRLQNVKKEAARKEKRKKSVYTRALGPKKNDFKIPEKYFSPFEKVGGKRGSLRLTHRMQVSEGLAPWRLHEHCKYRHIRDVAISLIFLSQ